MGSKKFSVQSLGIAAFKIDCQAGVIYLDAFAEGVDLTDYNDATIILITHADPDHFDLDKVNDVIKKTSPLVIGPQIVTDQLNYKNMVTLEPTETKAADYTSPTFSLKAYRTKHFVGHDAPNNSYYLEIDGKKIFISGDSHKIIGFEEIATNSDLYLYNFVIPKEDNLPTGIDAYLKPKASTVKGKMILSHMIDLDWVYTPEEISPLIEQMTNVIIHRKVGEVFSF